MTTQTQNTPSQTPWRKGISYIIECLKQKRSVRKAISEIAPGSSEEWIMFVWRIAGAIDTIRMRLAKKFEDEKVPDPDEKAYEKLIEILTNVEHEIDKIEKSLSNFPITIFLTTSLYEDIQVCVDLAKFIDRQKFNEYRNVIRSLGLKYNGEANCKQMYKLE